MRKYLRASTILSWENFHLDEASEKFSQCENVNFHIEEASEKFSQCENVNFHIDEASENSLMRESCSLSFIFALWEFYLDKASENSLNAKIFESEHDSLMREFSPRPS